MRHFSFEVIIFCLSVSKIVAEQSIQTNKYSEKTNLAADNENRVKIKIHPNPFRIQKLNFIWTKCAGRLKQTSNDEDLKKLKLELVTLDAMYLAAKQDKAVYSAKDPQKSDKMLALDKRLRLFLRTVDMEDVLDAIEMKSKWSSTDEENDRNEEAFADRNEANFMAKVNFDEKAVNFADKRLQELWENARRGGFSEDELQALYEEFKHHEQRIGHFNEMSEKFNEISSNEGPEEYESDSVNSVIQDFDKNVQDKSEKLLTDTKYMKQVNREIQEGYRKFEEKIRERPTIFSNEKVQSLWLQAQNKGAFSAEQLQSLHIELTHFDRRLDKLRFFENELSRSNSARLKKGKKALNLNDDDDDIDNTASRLDELNRKAQKHELYIVSKIDHGEL